MKRILSFVAATLLLLTCASCKSKGPATEESETPYKRYSSPVHFTTIRQEMSGVNFPEGMDLTHNPYVDYMKKELNVSYEFLWLDSQSDDHLLLDLTAGALPDVFFVNKYATYEQLYQSDMLADLRPAFDAYASDQMKEQYASYGDAIFSPFTKGEHLYALPMTNNGYQQCLLWVRQDWLDALGLPVPQTIDDIEKTALAFMNQDPGGNGPGKTIGLNIAREHSFDNYRSCFGLEVLASAMGAYPRQFMKRDNGEIYYGSIEPEFKRVLQKVRDWVSLGIIPENNFEIGDQSVTWNNAVSGNTGMWFFPWSWPYENSAFVEKCPRGELTTVAAPLNESGDGRINYYTGAPYEGMLCVRKGYENPEVIFKVFQLYLDMNTGVHQEGYDALAPVREAGTPWYYIAPLASYDCRYNDTLLRTAQEMIDYVDNGVEPEIFPDSTREQFDHAKNWKEGSGDPNDWVYYMSWYKSVPVEGDEKYNAITPAFNETTPTMLDRWNDLVSMEQQMIRAVLTGEKGLDAFDQFVEDWRSGGGDQILQEVTEKLAERG